MREFESTIKQAIINGLRKEDTQNRNAPYLEEAYNIRCEKTGAEPFSPITDPFIGTVAVSHPFPHLHVGEHDTLLMFESEIRRVNKSVSPWTSAAINVVPSITGGTTVIPSGGQWHIADLKNAWYLFNGECVIAKINEPGEPDQIYLETDIVIKTGTHFRGRVVVGGIDPTDIWSRNWDDILEAWEETFPLIPEYSADDVGSNYVMWSSIGGGDFPLWLFKPDIIERGTVDTEGFIDEVSDLPDTFIIDKLRTGQFGFMPMPFDGEVMNVKPLGNGVMVYGSEGIVYMPHVTGIDPAPTFGMRHLLRTGVVSRGAVGGTDNQHIFIGSDGALWSINSELSITRLGYKHLMDNLTLADTVISVNPERNDYYISDGTTCYLLAYGMSQVYQLPTSLAFEGGELVGVISEDADDDALVVSNIFDFNQTAIKTITGVGFGVDSSNSLDTAIDYRYKRGEAFDRSKFVVLNKEGNVTLRVAGTDFRIVLRADDFSGFNLDYITVRWQASDLRNIRGVNVGTVFNE